MPKQSSKTTSDKPAPINAALATFDQLPDAAFVRLPTVAPLCGVSPPTIWRWVKAGRLPAPVKRGGVTAWQVGALRRALAAA